jgi:uncharacterized SAM-binding protein YcdF (DUF218 family)
VPGPRHEYAAEIAIRTISGVSRRFAAAFACLFLVALLVSSAVLFVWPGHDSPGRASAVVVLAGSKKPRLDKALGLMRAGVAPVLVISDGRDPSWPQANRLCAGHAPFQVICFHASPYSTRGEAENVASIAARRHWRSLVVVTSTYHVRRAKLLFERCFPGRVQTVGAHYGVSALPEILASEWAKLVYALTVARDC